MNLPPPFRSLHSSLFIAFHYLPSPFLTSHRRPISLSAHSLLSRFVLTSPRFVLTSPRFVLVSPRFLLALPRFVLVSLPFCPHLAPVLSSPCPRIPPLHTCFPPASSPLLFHTSVFHAPLSAPLCFASLCFTPSIVLHRFALLSPIVYPPSLYLLPLFCTRFFTPRQPPQIRPRHRKRQRFSHFSKKFCKKPLTKQKKVLY